jgi:phosphoglycerol transferase MdoB-like AlkP superfamily enzyme
VEVTDVLERITMDNQNQKHLKGGQKWILRFLLIGLFVFWYAWMVSSDVSQIVTGKGLAFVIASLLYIVLCLGLIYRVGNSYVYKMTNMAGMILFAVVVPYYAVYLEEYIWNSYIWLIDIRYIVLNYVLILLIEIGLLILVNNPAIVYIALLICACVYGMINYYVLEFKGTVPTPNDFLAIGTAMNVAKQYSYAMSDEMIVATVLVLLAINIFVFIPVNKFGRKKLSLKRIITGFVYCFSLCFLLYNCRLNDIFAIDIDAWWTLECVEVYGAPISFLTELQNMKLTIPDGYSRQEAESILEKYDTNETEKISDLETMPSVIVIMNESFSDLSVLGSFESDDYLPYWNSMDDYIMKGYVFASVVGGGTCNSEFEFLTGNSMANLNSGTYPYQTLNLKNCESMVAAFNELGYETKAIHPANESNWNRNNIYSYFGFSDFLSIEDMTDIEYLSWRPSDNYNYKQVIKAYEESDGPIFIFNISMQNHGGYYYAPDESLVSPVTIEEQYLQYDDVGIYLTLIKESDNAFEELINYFSNQEKPVILCLFGDHQPDLDDEFINSLLLNSTQENVIESRYITPYVIWSNFDTGMEAENRDMSINYLGAQLLHILGVETSYSDYLLDMESEVPIINAAGYQTLDGIWHTPDEENEKINEYRIVQYYQMTEADK